MKVRSVTRVVPLAACLLACGGNPPPAPANPGPAPAASEEAAVPPPATAVNLPPWASQYPKSRTVDQKDVIFGTEVRDPYRWLEDVKSPEVQAWMKAQDDLARARLATLPDREQISLRLKELAYVNAMGIPVRRANRLFYTRRSGTQEKAVAYVREGAPRNDGKERVLLDPNTWSADGSSSLHSWTISWDGKHVAYNRSENNSDEATMYVLDVDTGKVSAKDVIPGTKYGEASWTPAGDGFYYTRLPVDPAITDEARPGFAEVRFHKLGTDPAKDPLVREKTGDPTKSLSGWLSKDGHWLFSAVSHGWTSTDLYFRDTRKKGAGWTTIAEGKDALYNPIAYKDRLFVHTNEGAPKWRVFSVDPAHPERDAWKEIVPERQDATLDGVSIVGGALALVYLKDVTTHIELHDLQGKLLHELVLPAIGSADISGDPDYDDAYFSFETFNYPFEIHSFSVHAAVHAKPGGKPVDTVLFKQKVPVDPAAYVVEQIFFNSKDGTRVPMFVVRGKGMPRDGKAPAFITGYGGFSSSETPYFRKSIFPWLERGGVFVDVNLRGGGEYGEGWHRAGMLQNKQNVFDDLTAAVETLVNLKITSTDRTMLWGGSNGGLLVGAAITERPDLYRVAICAVPLLDMVRYHLFGAGQTWASEYGTAEKEADFRTLFAYSPYHHVKPGTAYPSILFTSADSDDRVDPMHARKMAAELQAASTGGPVLLRIEKNSGHGGADLVKSWIDEWTDNYAFTLAEMRKVGATMEAPASAPAKP